MKKLLVDEVKYVSFLVVAIFVMAVVITSPVQAALIELNSKTTGGFGNSNTGGIDMTEVWSFTKSGEQIQITATGFINLVPPSSLWQTGPDGLEKPIDGFIISTNHYFPLEEAGVDSGSLVLPRSVGVSISQVGALMGAFVTEATAASPSFFARDEDLVSSGTLGISSSNLFFVGSGPFSFTAPSPGRLFLGVNDTFAANNNGQFDVSINAVPIPSAVILFGSALVGIFSFMPRRISTMA